MTSSDSSYQGWTNYPTWAVNLWMANEEPLYREALEMAEQALVTYRAQDESPMRKTLSPDEIADATRDLADAFEEHFGEIAREPLDDPEAFTGMAADLLGYALDQVDWKEIAASWIEDATE
jgi:AcrR family transcriptional regulator